MRISAQIVIAVVFLVVVTSIFKPTAYAQTDISPTPIVATTAQSSDNTGTYLNLNTDSNVPQNRDSYTQVVLINMVSAVMCQLTGVDTTNPQQPCLGVDPSTGKIGMISTQNAQGQNVPQIGGALGLMSGYISALYIPAVSTSQYVNYLSSNFGIVKPSYAATTAGTGTTANPNCATSFGYGFCGLTPIFTLWTGIRDFSYALLTVLFIAIGIGVMVRFKVDPRTVMTLQNQIPRVIIAIILITFSYAIAGAMIDLMWTATYAGINFISNESKATICLPNTNNNNPQAISHVLDTRLADDPLSFTNTIFRGPNQQGNCNNVNNDAGLVTVSSDVSLAFGDLVTQTIADLLGIQNGCGINWDVFHDIGCLTQDAFGKALIWFTEKIVELIMIIALLIAMFRLWFELIKCYVTFLIFVIMGPIWIVFGLIPGRPLGFEKWLRIIFSNLAAFPLVAFILVFARVIVDAIPPQVDLNNTFIPPLIGNPNLSTFTAFVGFGAIMLAPSIPNLIKERMKATGQGKYGATVAAGLGFAAGAMSSPGKKTWDTLNRKDPQTGHAIGTLALVKQRAWEKTPYFGKRAIGKRTQLENVRRGYEYVKDPKTGTPVMQAVHGYEPGKNASIGDQTQKERNATRQPRRWFGGRTGRQQQPPPSPKPEDEAKS